MRSGAAGEVRRIGTIGWSTPRIVLSFDRLSHIIVSEQQGVKEVAENKTYLCRKSWRREELEGLNVDE